MWWELRCYSFIGLLIKHFFKTWPQISSRSHVIKLSFEQSSWSLNHGYLSICLTSLFTHSHLRNCRNNWRLCPRLPLGFWALSFCIAAWGEWGRLAYDNKTLSLVELTTGTETWLLFGSVVGWGTMLQDRRSCVRFPMWWIFLNLPNSSSRIMV
jgi:hypothetical protein